GAFLATHRASGGAQAFLTGAAFTPWRDFARAHDFLVGPQCGGRHERHNWSEAETFTLIRHRILSAYRHWSRPATVKAGIPRPFGRYARSATNTSRTSGRGAIPPRPTGPASLRATTIARGSGHSSARAASGNRRQVRGIQQHSLSHLGSLPDACAVRIGLRRRGARLPRSQPGDCRRATSQRRTHWKARRESRS